VSVLPRELYQAPRSWAEQPTPTSSTSTRSTRATTLRPGRSRNSSRPRFVPCSGHCARGGAMALRQPEASADAGVEFAGAR
jgi:hypothetical protein